MGFKKDGTLTAIKTDMLGFLGAYMACGPMASVIGMSLVMGLYRCPNLAGEADMVMTNTPPSGAMRGFGNEVMSFGVEQLLDEAAEKLGIDPVEIRLKNAKHQGDVAPFGLYLESTYLEDCLRLGGQAFGWGAKAEAPRAAEESGVTEEKGSRGEARGGPVRHEPLHGAAPSIWSTPMPWSNSTKTGPST